MGTKQGLKRTHLGAQRGPREPRGGGRRVMAHSGVPVHIGDD